MIEGNETTNQIFLFLYDMRLNLKIIYMLLHNGYAGVSCLECNKNKNIHNIAGRQVIGYPRS